MGKSLVNVQKLNDFVSVKDFGAKGDGVTDDTAAIQAALDASVASVTNNKVVFLPAGDYIVSTIYIPVGASLTGDGQTMQGSYGLGSVLRQKAGSNSDVIRFKAQTLSGPTYWWYGVLNDFCIIGNTSSTGGYGINFKDVSGNKISIQNDARIENISVRKMYSGGIIMYGALPLWFRNVNVFFNKGYGVTFEAIYSTQYQSILFDNLSGDGNVGGLVLLKDFTGQYGQVTFLNLKAEAKSNPDYSTGTDDQLDTIVVTNSSGLSINVLGATAISAIPDGGNFKKPRYFISITDGSTPTITWDNVVMRVRAGDTGADPSIVNCSSISIPYTRTSGSLGAFDRGLNSYSNNITQVVGPVSTYQAKSVENVSIQVASTSPGTSLYETDGATDQKMWLTVASGGNLTRRTVTDAGVSSSYETVQRSAGVASRIDYAVPTRHPSLQITDGITAPSTVSGYALIYVDSSDGDLKVKFGDGTVKTIVVDT